MIVFGTKGVTKKRGTGTFWCPNCDADRKYTLFEVSKKGHVFFVSVIDRGSLGQYVQCKKCGGQFDTAVLGAPTKEAVATDLNMMIRGCIAVTISADSSIDDQEIEAARSLVEDLTGSDIGDGMQRRDVEIADIDDLQPMLVHFSERLSEKGKVQILDACVRVAAADGDVSSIEQHMIRRIAVPLGVPVQYLPGIIDEATRA